MATRDHTADGDEITPAPRTLTITVSLWLTNLAAVSVFVLALVLSFFGYVLKTKAGAQSYEDSEDARREDLIDDAASKSEVDGMKI
jgi:nitrogen fixation-related uncharacterized protein